ncbi:MAG: hypothetical protein E4G94_00925 [ANME-2 cluster archaeon]|nr:MAG: hypothetical protein E4G94_00925 [ANME-2 cluster archaeon]
MVKKIVIILFVLALMVVPSMAANESMNIKDIENTEPTVPFGVDFFTMIMSSIKWFAFFGFMVGIASVIAHGTIANALNNANMSAGAQTALFNIGKILLVAAGVYIAGSYIFKTFL